MYQIDFQHPIHVYFCGIGGISMSGLAEILKSKGFRVSGSDRDESAVTRHLRDNGIPVYTPQKAENITDDIDLVVFTAAIHEDNPEYIAVSEKKIPFLSRAELLGEMMKNYTLPVAIAGTHGKTTTTAMVSDILLQAETDPTLSIGGNLLSIGGNVRIGSEDFFVAEACEYTNSFLSFFPKIGIILNIEEDHLDFFKDLADIRNSFREFAKRIPEDGYLIINNDIPQVEEITQGLPCHVVTFGSTVEADYCAAGISYDEKGLPSFTVCTDKAALVKKQVEVVAPKSQEFSLGVVGEHNIYNALSAIAAADLCGIDRADTREALLRFNGTERRFQYYGEKNGFNVIDDYAHHPTEIEATLSAARNYPHRKLFVVFQPHTYTRTKALLPEFADALSKADVVILADIYAARETDTLGISSSDVADEIRLRGTESHYFPSFEEIEAFILQNCGKNDLLITMGAGNVDTIAKDLMKS